MSELASFELLSRKAQMAEWRHRDRILGRSKDELFDDQFLYLGTGETRGLLMVAPELQEHINQELHREATILKEKRKVREERSLARGGSSGKDSQNKELQKKVNQQAEQLRRLQAGKGDGQQGDGEQADEAAAGGGRGRRRGRG